MMSEIQNCVSRLISKSSSLLENKTNNICEQFNSVINKHIGGKRINFSSRGNYNTRIEAAVVAFNSKQFLRKIHKKITKYHSPGNKIQLIQYILYFIKLLKTTNSLMRITYNY